MVFTSRMSRPVSGTGGADELPGPLRRCWLGSRDHGVRFEHAVNEAGQPMQPLGIACRRPPCHYPLAERRPRVVEFARVDLVRRGSATTREAEACVLRVDRLNRLDLVRLSALLSPALAARLAVLPPRPPRLTHRPPGVISNHDVSFGS